MDNIGKILEAVKLYGIGAVVSVAMFFYFNSRISKLEAKYDDCMNARINEAYRVDYSDNNTIGYLEMLAVLPKSIKIKRRNEGA